MEDVRWSAEQLEEHRLEISNRIRNLFWTVSGDYDTEFETDTEKYVYSKQTVLYGTKGHPQPEKEYQAQSCFNGNCEF